MELVPGRTLADELRARGRLPVADAVELVRQIAEAADAAHAAGVVHRDLKPANVMLEGSGAPRRVKVLDFGIAKLIDDRGKPSLLAAESADVDRAADLTATGAIFGTPLYMSPEQARGARVDARTDVWSLGVMLYELLSGATPFGRATGPATLAAILGDDPPPLAGVPEPLERLVGRALAKAPDRRIGSARELATELVRAGGAVASATAADTLGSELRVGPLPPTNLPDQTDLILGRAEDVRAVANLLREGARLVTLTGPGGTGKTRLARTVARDLVADFADGVYFVDLSAIRDPLLVAPTIARALGLEEPGGAPAVDALAGYLVSRRLLLVLDNFEQVVDAAPLVARLLDDAPALRSLVTSRAPLRVSAERVVPVAPLELPPAGRPTDVDALLRYPSVALFAERAREAKRGFTLTERNAGAVADICRRLDGLPLAIELAAARVRILTPEALLARLDDRLRVLTHGDRDLPERQRTMHAAVAWSYDLLGASEQRVFERFAVFEGGCSLAHAEAVCGGPDIDVLDAVTALVESSLVATVDDPSGEPRFRMLQVTRELALDRLEASGDADRVRAAHADAYATFAAVVAPEIVGPTGAAAYAALDAEVANLRAALARRADRDADGLLRLASSLANFWVTRGQAQEGRRWIDAGLERSSGVSPAERARALRNAGNLARIAFDLPAARSRLEEALQLSEQLGDARGVAVSRLNLGKLAIFELDPVAAKAHLEACLGGARALGDDVVVASALAALSDVSMTLGDRPGARRAAAEALEAAERLGRSETVGVALDLLGACALEEGDLEAAFAHFHAALRAFAENSNPGPVCEMVDRLAAVAAKRGDAALAGRLLGAASARREDLDWKSDARTRAFRDGLVDEIRASLGDDAYRRADEAGRALALDEAVALARSATGEGASSPSSALESDAP